MNAIICNTSEEIIKSANTIRPPKELISIGVEKIAAVIESADRVFFRIFSDENFCLIEFSISI